MSDELKIGQRDAVHMAYVVAQCNMGLEITPGESVQFVNESATLVKPCLPDDSRHGVADPFLIEDIAGGELFRVFLKPGLSTNVRHQFDLILSIEPEPDEDEPEYRLGRNDGDDWCGRKGC